MVLVLGTSSCRFSRFYGVLDRRTFCPTTWNSYIWRLTRHEDGFCLNSWSCKITGVPNSLLLPAEGCSLNGDEQTSEIEKQQSQAVGRGNNKTSDDREENSNGPSKLGSRNTKSVVYVVEVIHTKELVLLKAKSV